jgi:hypothetical protein
MMLIFYDFIIIIIDRKYLLHVKYYHSSICLRYYYIYIFYTIYKENDN